ncbi:MAG: hypothetical protein ABSH32_08785 [Bryobacteraceae bacterium]|jgi:hypothetical protein
MLPARNPAPHDHGPHFGDIFQRMNPVSESEFIWNDTGIVGELPLRGAAAGKYPAPQQDVRRIEVLAGKRCREFTHRASAFFVTQSCARENELEAASMVTFLESAHEKSNVNSLSTRIRVGLVQHDEPQSFLVKNLSVARAKEQVLQHREIR